MSRPKAVLFDAGGTLVTMLPGRFGDLVEPIVGSRPDPDTMLAAHYRTMHAIEENRHILDRPEWWRWWIQRYLVNAGLEAPPAAVDALAGVHGMWREPLPGSNEGVAALVAAGFRVAVVSNAEGRVASDLQAAGFDGMFEAVVDSTLVGVSKPDPAIFGFALEALGVAPAEAWYVGDSLIFDRAGAEAAGLGGFVLIDPFRLRSHDPQVTSLTELPELLAG